MRYVSATEAKQALAAVLDAAQREPVVIRRQQREVAVILSMQEYERLICLEYRRVPTLLRPDRRAGQEAWSDRGEAEPNYSPVTRREETVAPIS